MDSWADVVTKFLGRLGRGTGDEEHDMLLKKGFSLRG
jgi:hypothetical protein